MKNIWSKSSPCQQWCTIWNVFVSCPLYNSLRMFCCYRNDSRSERQCWDKPVKINQHLLNENIRHALVHFKQFSFLLAKSIIAVSFDFRRFISTWQRNTSWNAELCFLQNVIQDVSRRSPYFLLSQSWNSLYWGTIRGSECHRVAPTLPRWAERGWRPLLTRSDRTSSTPGRNKSGWRVPESVGYKCLKGGRGEEKNPQIKQWQRSRIITPLQIISHNINKTKQTSLA